MAIAIVVAIAMAATPAVLALNLSHPVLVIVADIGRHV
jgi:hypothetical protein